MCLAMTILSIGIWSIFTDVCSQYALSLVCHVNVCLVLVGAWSSAVLGDLLVLVCARVRSCAAARLFAAAAAIKLSVCVQL